MNKFNKIYNLIMEDINNINSPRQALQKIDKMTTKSFLKFLKEILPLFKENELDLQKVTITEKIDGSAIRLIMNNGNLLFESSYSGVVEWNDMPFPEQTKWMKINLENKLKNISKEIGFDYKIIGELIWCDQLVENDKITPVTASYLAKHFGDKGSIIIIDLKKIEDNKLIDLTSKEFFELTNLLKAVNDKEFSFYSKQQDMVFDEGIKLSLDINKLNNFLKLPECNKERYTKKDQKFIDEVNTIKHVILNQLESIINSTTGHFSEKGDLIEGLILTILNTGHEYGIFSKNYKSIKSEYVKYEVEINNLYKECLMLIFGNSMTNLIKSKYNKYNYKKYKENFNRVWNDFLIKFENNLLKLKDDKSIPLGTKFAQVSILTKKLSNYKNIKSFDDLLNMLGINNE